MAASITTWPTEVLFSFFYSLDPLEFPKFAQVCKKWSQMSVDNELWRRFCERRWDVLPKEKDFAKNWLIPMREGGADKERRVDWKRVYLMRDLGEKAEEAILSLLPAKKSAPNWIKALRKKKKASNEPSSIFSNGWLSVKDLDSLNGQAQKALDKMMEHVADGREHGNIGPKLLYIANFHMELELQIMSLVNISRVKHATYGSDFLRENKDAFATNCLDKLPQLVANFSQKYCAMAVQKDVPTDTVAQHLMSCTELFEIWHPSADFDSPVYLKPLSQFIGVLIKYLHDAQLNEAWKLYISDPSIELVPTLEIAESVNYMSMSLKRYHNAFDLFVKPLQALPASVKRDVTTVCVIYAITEGCSNTIVEDIPSFMDKYFFPYFRMSENLDVVIAALLYYAPVPTLLSDASGSSVPDMYAARILPVLLNMLESPNLRVQSLVCAFISSFCHTSYDAEKYEPYLAPLLDKLYGILTTDSETIRHDAVDAVTSLLMISDHVFIKYGDEAMKQLRKLLSRGDKSTRDVVMEALGRLGTVLSPENKASVANDVTELYSQAVEDFKNARDESKEEAMLKMTEFAVNSLGKAFAPFLPIVLPLLFEKAAAETSTIHTNDDRMDLSDGDEEEEDENDSFLHKFTQHTFVNALESKIMAITGIRDILKNLDSETLQPYLEQMREHLVTSLNGIISEDLRTVCLESYAEFLTKHKLSTSEAIKNDTVEWNSFVDVLNGQFELYMDVSSKERVVKALNQIVEHMLELVPDLESNHHFMGQLTSFITKLVELFRSDFSYGDDNAKVDFASEISDYATKVFSAVKDKQCYLNGAGATLLQSLVNYVKPWENTGNEETESDWLLLCIISSFCETFAKEIVAKLGVAPLTPLCEFFEKHLDEEAPPMIQQVVVYHYGVMAEKCPELLPTGDKFNELVAWVEERLTLLSRASTGTVYDNALMAYMNIIYYHHAKLGNIHEKIVKVSECFPPALDGDWAEVVAAFKKLRLLFEEKPEWFTAEIKKHLIEGLEDTVTDAKDEERKKAALHPIRLFIAKLN